MKTNNYKILSLIAIFAIVAVGVVLFQSCNKDRILTELVVRHLDENKDAEIIDEIMSSGDRGIPFPAGSKAYKDRDGRHVLILSEGYYWVVVSDNNRQSSYLSTQVSFKCNCTEGDINACFPISINGYYICGQEKGCTNCHIEDMATTNSRGDYETVEIVGMINTKTGITLITDQNIPNQGKFSLPLSNMDVIHGNAFDELFDLDDVKEYLDDLINSAAQEGTDLNTYTYVSIYGNLALIPYPENVTNISVDGINLSPICLPSNSSVNDKITCTCTSGSGCELKHKNYLGLHVYYCDPKGTLERHDRILKLLQQPSPLPEP